MHLEFVESKRPVRRLFAIQNFDESRSSFFSPLPPSEASSRTSLLSPLILLKHSIELSSAALLPELNRFLAHSFPLFLANLSSTEVPKLTRKINIRTMTRAIRMNRSLNRTDRPHCLSLPKFDGSLVSLSISLSVKQQDYGTELPTTGLET